MKQISPKVTASTIASALVLVACWIASEAGVEVPVEVQGAVAVILVALAGYFTTDPRRS